MRTTLICRAIAMLMPLSVHAAEPAMFHLAVADVPVENGKLLNMDFQEISRTPDASVIVVTRRSGGSVSTSMFILRGICGVARARGKRQFVPERVAGEGERYTVTFPATLPEGGNGFSIEQCDLMHY